MSDQIIDIIPNVRITPVGRRDWSVSLDGRIVAMCSQKKDAMLIEQAFQTAAQVPMLQQHIWALQDVLEQKYSSVVERLRKRFIQRIRSHTTCSNHALGVGNQ
jgi:uncharacterized protein with PIN domain